MAIPPAPPSVGIGAPRPPAKDHTILIVVILVVVIVVVLAVVAIAALGFFSGFVKSTVSVSQVDWTGSNSCGGLPGSTTHGFLVFSGGSISYSVVVTNGNPSACTINSVTASTAGFSVSGANVPLTVPASNTLTLTFSIAVPSSYSGVLTLVVA